MSTNAQIYEVSISAGDWTYPIYFSKNSAGFWETYHVADYTDPKSSLEDAVQRFTDYLKSEWNLPNLVITATAPIEVSIETAQRNSPGALGNLSGGAFHRPPHL